MPANRHSFTALLTSLTISLITTNLSAADYSKEIKPLLARKCFSCHGALKQEAGLRLDTVAGMQQGGDSGSAILAGDADASLLVYRISTDDKAERMPPDGEPLTHEQVTAIAAWITQGATHPPDEQPQQNPAEHWAFQPLHQFDSDISQTLSIDHFVKLRLQAEGLSMSDAADRATLIRRLYLDMHGLPPTPQQVAAFLNNDHPDVWNDLVEEVLASPRYGERWAQHWLDVVRYADTHGFEVNTPRPNAWPYRDYVIQAFNEDKPYNQFVTEQLAGDTSNADVATGFLVAAPVLLPGQIGKDAASMRLARQDALDEIIVGTGATFLGLTIGCARCHDHKFDPITQKDYYSMQAFFAGVEYGDREVRDDKYQQRLQQAKSLQPRIDELVQQLQQFEPVAYAGRTIIIDDEDSELTSVLSPPNGHGTNPEGSQRGYLNDVGSVDRMGNLSKGRYTWWPNESGRDVFTWNPNASGRFRVWISWGVHGSGVHTRDARYVLDTDGNLETTEDQQQIATADQYYFAGVSDGESERKPLWSGLSYAGIHSFSPLTRLVLRGGETGTGITADVIVLQEVSDDALFNESPLPHLRSSVSPQHNVEVFPPVEARFVRFTSFETLDNNRHEPCLDELEVFGTDSQSVNLGLATAGTIATSSGNYSNSGRHQLPHINDGQYGNERSWISNEHGRGWVQLEFKTAHQINRIEWARDRNGKFKDRLPVDYQIEVSPDGQAWKTVASSADRVPLDTPHDPELDRVRNPSQGVSADSDDPQALVARLNQLQKEQDQLEKPQSIFAGVFRAPDTTHMLNRGDPEQPGEVTAPQVPAVFASMNPQPNLSESERRVELARWIADSSNPLTARVMVNRIWQQHFGTGLVSTPSDFGLNGQRPSHPQLLDWLATEFIRSGWSVKHIHRLILNSATYQQSSHIRKDAVRIDSDSRLLWRFVSRRLEAESIRDSMLAVSGTLNLRMGGPGFNFFKTRGGLSGFPPIEEFTPNELRRMIYAHKIRMEPVPVFGAFDCPDAGQAMPARSQSTTAIQALNLFNSQFVADQSAVFAKRVRKEAGDDINQQIDTTFQLALGRSPTDAERSEISPVLKTEGLETLCRVLFNTSEFLFIP